MHAVARTGFDAVGASGLYNSARPSYPPEAISALLRGCTPSPPRAVRIIELGCGTGISTRALLDHKNASDSRISRIRAIEPSAGMRLNFADTVIQKYAGKDVDITVEDGTFEEFPIGEADADCVFAAQAFHWCLDHDRFVTNAAAALRPGGILALLWNIEDDKTANWVATLRKHYQAFEGSGVPQYHHGTWRRLLSNPHFTSTFAPVDELHIRRSIPTTLQGVKDGEKNTINQFVDGLLGPSQSEGADEKLGRVWIDKSSGTWEYPYITDLFLFRKL